MADINQDGWLDIFICNAGYANNQKPRCQLYINNKDLSFTDKAAEYGLLNEGGYTTHAAFLIMIWMVTWIVLSLITVLSRSIR